MQGITCSLLRAKLTRLLLRRYHRWHRLVVLDRYARIGGR